MMPPRGTRKSLSPLGRISQGVDPVHPGDARTGGALCVSTDALIFASRSAPNADRVSSVDAHRDVDASFLALALAAREEGDS